MTRSRAVLALALACACAGPNRTAIAQAHALTGRCAEVRADVRRELLARFGECRTGDCVPVPGYLVGKDPLYLNRPPAGAAVPDLGDAVEAACSGEPESVVAQGPAPEVGSREDVAGRAPYTWPGTPEYVVRGMTPPRPGCELGAVAGTGRPELVVVKAVIGANGVAHWFEFLNAASPIAQRAAIDAFRRCDWKPALDANGQPVRSYAVIPVRMQ